MKTNIKNSYACDFETLVLTKEQIEAGMRTYVWAWGCCKVYDNDNYYVIFGTSIDSFMEYAKTLHKPVLFFHNLKFDGSFIVWWLLKNGYKWSKEKEPKTFDTMINKQGIWYQISIVWDAKGRNKHETIIQDSLKKMPYSISAIAKNFGFDSDMQKLEIDYNGYREENGVLSGTDKEYLRHDVVILARALKMLFEEGFKKMTTGSDTLANFKENIGGEKQFTKYFPVLDHETDKMLRKSYAGGFVYVNKKYAKISENGQIGICCNIDKNSMHPSMMCTREMPYGLPNYFEGEYTGDSKCYIQHFLCRFDVKDRYIPTIQIKKTVRYCDTEYLEHSRIDDYIDEQVELWLPSPDLEIFFKHYNVYDIEYLDGFYFKTAKGQFFNDYINSLMKTKETSEGVKRLMAKLRMNALYGKFGTNPEVKEKEPYLLNDVLKFRTPTHPEFNEDGEIVEVEDVTIKDPIYLPLAIFITAWSRYDIISTIDKVNESYINYNSDKDRFIYVDTDSVHMIGWHIPKSIKIHDTHLDCWKVETYNIGAKYLRQKTYIDKVICKTNKEKKKWLSKVKEYEKEHKESGMTWKDFVEQKPPHFGYERGSMYLLEVKCAGMPDKIKDILTYDAFKVGFKSDQKLIGHQVKGGVVLMIDKFEIKAKK